MDIRQKSAVALVAATLTAAPASAEPLAWSAGVTDLGGKIAITYDAVATDKIKTLVATPLDGETLTVTGEAMTFAAGATISMAADGRLIFANNVTADGALSLNRTDGAYCDWTATKDGALSKGYCLRTSSQKIFADKSLADWELVGAFAYADAELVRPISQNKLGNKPAVTSSNGYGTWSYSNIAGVYSPIKLLVTQSDGAITRKEYVVNRWSGEYTYSARLWLDQNGGGINGKIRTAVCGGQFVRNPDADLWRGASGSSDFWTGWYGDSANDHANPNYFGSPYYLAINRVVIRKVGSDVATVGFAGEATLGGQTDVALGVKLAVLPKESGTFAAPVFSGEGDVEYQRNATLANVNLMKYASNLSVTNAPITVTHSGAFPTNAVVDVWKDGVVLANTGFTGYNYSISGGWFDVTVRKGGAFRTQSGMYAGFDTSQLVEIDGGTLWFDYANGSSSGNANRYIRYLTLMNGAEVKGVKMRVGNNSDNAPYWHVTGSQPSTNGVQVGTYGLGQARRFTIDVDDVAEGTDFVFNGKIVDGGNSGSTSYEMDIVKAGTGTLEMNNTVQLHSGRAVIVEGGTFRFGVGGGFASTTSSKDITLNGGTLAKAGGTQTFGVLSVGDAGGALELGPEATMTFADSSGQAWDGPLTIKGYRDKAIRFGTSSDALSPIQQTLIKTVEGHKLHLLSTGYLAPRGISIIIR